MKVLFLLFAFCNSALATDDLQMFNAIELDNISTVKKAIASGEYNVNSKIRVAQVPNVPPLYEAAPLIVIAGRAASLRVLKFLIENNAGLNARTENNDTALILAAYYNDESYTESIGYDRHIEAVKLLIAAGASLENIPDAFTPLAAAATAKHTDIVRLLLKHGANPDGTAVGEQTKVSTPLIMAIRSRDEEIVRLILEHGANPRIKDVGSHSPWDWANHFGDTAIVSMLKCALTMPVNQQFKNICKK